MAKKQEKPEKTGQTGGREKKPFSVRFAIFMVLVAALVFLPFTIVFLVCMIPTIVSSVIDNHRQKTAWLTVGAMNLAGTIPVLFTLAETGRTLGGAVQIISTPANLLMAYGGAAAGVFIYNYITPMVASVVFHKNEKRLRDIEKRQKELIKKWGEEVV
jgi:hypothetical protein